MAEQRDPSLSPNPDAMKEHLGFMFSNAPLLVGGDYCGFHKDVMYRRPA